MTWVGGLEDFTLQKISQMPKDKCEPTDTKSPGESNSQEQKAGWQYVGGARGRGWGRGRGRLRRGGEGRTATGTCLMPLSCTLKNGENGDFHGMCILPPKELKNEHPTSRRPPAPPCVPVPARCHRWGHRWGPGATELRVQVGGLGDPWRPAATGTSAGPSWEPWSAATMLGCPS